MAYRRKFSRRPMRRRPMRRRGFTYRRSGYSRDTYTKLRLRAIAAHSFDIPSNENASPVYDLRPASHTETANGLLLANFEAYRCAGISARYSFQSEQTTDVVMDHYVNVVDRPTDLTKPSPYGVVRASSSSRKRMSGHASPL